MSNHNIPFECPACGKEYDAHLHWYICPHCGVDALALRSDKAKLKNVTEKK